MAHKNDVFSKGFSLLAFLCFLFFITKSTFHCTIINSPKSTDKCRKFFTQRILKIVRYFFPRYLLIEFTKESGGANP